VEEIGVKESYRQMLSGHLGFTVIALCNPAGPDGKRTVAIFIVLSRWTSASGARLRPASL